jgi:hypothetical protein
MLEALIELLVGLLVNAIWYFIQRWLDRKLP